MHIPWRCVSGALQLIQHAAVSCTQFLASQPFFGAPGHSIPPGPHLLPQHRFAIRMGVTRWHHHQQQQGDAGAVAAKGAAGAMQWGVASLRATAKQHEGAELQVGAWMEVGAYIRVAS